MAALASCALGDYKWKNAKNKRERGHQDRSQTDSGGFNSGINNVETALAELLGRHGVREIDADGKFDPHVHEALLSQPSEAEEGSVIDVVQKGYTLGDRVVRPARVVVAAAPPQPEGEAETER